MAKLLYIEASPRKERSASIEVAHAFLEEYRKLHPKDEIAVVDLWEKALPEFDGDVIDAKYAIMSGKPSTDAQKRAWKAVEDVIAEFKSADKYVISIPMWNFGIPYKLKHYIDVITQPGYTFSFSQETGYSGLVNGKKIALIYARGGAYGAETGASQLDFQTTYMQTALGFIGLTEQHAVVVEPTVNGGPEKKAEAVKAGKALATKIADKY